MLVLASAMGALTGGVAFLNTVPAFGIGVALIGIFLAPSIVTGYLAAERLVAQHAQTQASVWTNTALNPLRPLPTPQRARSSPVRESPRPCSSPESSP